jgi:hypothetical protein
MAEPIKLDDPGNSSGLSSKITIGAPTGNTSTSASSASSANGGSMGNIFTQSQAKKEDSKMITSIISQKDVAQKTKSILGPAPTLEKSIEQEKQASLKSKLRLFQFIFLMLFVASVAMAFYFYAELSPDFTWFGANTTQRLTDTNTNLRQVQKLINKDNYMAAQLKLNEFSYQSDRFLSSVSKINDPTINSYDKRAIIVDRDEAQKALPVLLGDIRGVLTKDIVIPTLRSEQEPEQTPEQITQAAQSDLRAALQDERKKYGSNPTNPQDILDAKLIDNSIKLVGNTPLLNALQTTSTDAFQKQLDDYAQAPDPQKLKALQAVIGKVLSSTKSDLATIADIKQNRIEWSTIIGQIKDVTIHLDGSNFDQPLLYDSLGGIVYTGYEFDTNSNKIVLSGTTKTFDGSNFTLMSNLIDHLENSTYFQDVDMRSFAKSKSGGTSNEGFTANFKIDLRLETQGFSTKDSPVNLQSDTLKGAAATGTKRTTDTTATQQLSASAPTVPTPPTPPATQEIKNQQTEKSDLASTPVETQQTAPVSVSAPTQEATAPAVKP